MKDIRSASDVDFLARWILTYPRQARKSFSRRNFEVPRCLSRRPPFQLFQLEDGFTT